MAKVTATTKVNLADKAGSTNDGDTEPETSEASEPVSRMMLAEHIAIVTAPAGPRRRAGFGFGPVPVELRWDDLGDTDEARETALNAIRADPMLKLDGRFEERPVED